MPANYLDQLHQIFIKSLTALDLPSEGKLRFEHPADAKFGDYSCNIAMTLFPSLKEKSYKNPKELAAAIVEELQKQVGKTSGLESLISKIDLAGPGFINVTFSNEFLYEQLDQILTEKSKIILPVNQGKRAIVEFSSPNIAKPFTIGHLRSTIIGDAVARILSATGWQVYRDNHLGDWGTQFGKQICAIKHFGSEAELDKSKQPVKDLVNLYIKFHQEAEQHPELEDEARAWFKKLEDGDPEARRLWQKCIDWSWSEFQKIYEMLNVTFTENGGRGYGESFFEDKMGVVVDELKAKHLLKESEGAQLVFFPEDVLPPLMILKKDGSTLYATRDLATDKFRKAKYGADITVINEVGAEQALYFKQLYALEELLGWYQFGQRIHIKHGHFRFQDKKMSTRKGNVIWLEEVLQQAHDHVEDKIKTIRVQGKDTNKKSSEVEIWQVAIGALKWNDLKREAVKEIVFDWDELLNLQGNSGPYVQYVHARCASILRKAEARHITPKSVLNVSKLYECNDEEKAVLRMLYQFNEVVQHAANELTPHYLCTYLFDLAQTFNTFYNSHSILGGEVENKTTISDDQRQFRVSLVQATATILTSGLSMLGIAAPDHM